MPLFLSWLRPAWDEYVKEQSFRIYLTDAVKIAAENTAHIGGGTIIRKRWIDKLDEQLVKEETRSAEEIIADVIDKSGITVV